MMDHLKSIHENMKHMELCNICLQKVLDRATHLVTHPACVSCQNRFIDLAALKQHEPGCYVILGADENENKQEIDNFSLNIDRNQVELSFVSTINQLLDAVGLDEKVQQHSKNCQLPAKFDPK